jgi:hypothetical protein
LGGFSEFYSVRQGVNLQRQDQTDVLEPYTHSFIVKVWLEETVEEAGTAIWRGRVTHVPSGERRYITKLDDILAFIAPYLQGMGVRLHKRWRVQQCLERLKIYLSRKLGHGGRGTR